jgi:hypothetical protein
MKKNNPDSRHSGQFNSPTMPTHSKETAGLKWASAHYAHYLAYRLKPFLRKGLRRVGEWASSLYIYTGFPRLLGHPVAHSGGLLEIQIGGTET